jgi:hypothetical protein
MLLFNEVEEHNDVTDDQTDQANDSQESHKPKRRAHDPERCKSPHNSVRYRCEDDERLDSVFELKHETEKYRGPG